MITPEQKIEKVIIYTLADPITNDVRYVGITTRDLNYRYKRHFYDKKNYKKNKWFKSLKEQSLKPIIKELDTVDFDGWQFWEQWYISLFKTYGFNLVNLTEGGEGMFGYKHTNETKEKIKEKRKNQIFTEETRELLSISSMKNKYALNKKHSIEQNKSKSINQRGKFGGEIIRTDIYNNSILFKSIRDAGESIGLLHKNIWYACTTRKGKLYKGYYWKYKDESKIQKKNNDKISYDYLYQKYIVEKVSGQNIKYKKTSSFPTA